MPELKEDEILVRVRCVALNPNDAKVLDMSPVVGATLGCDFAGDVVRIGPSVKMAAEGLLRLGDRVCGFVYGNHPNRPDNGAFAEFVAVPGDLVYTLPPELSYAQAATLPVGLSTVGLAFYHQWKLPLPYPSVDSGPASTPLPATHEPQYVLVYGGNTATGRLALQMLRRSGLSPLCTCSPAAFARVKALGAAEAFDYASPTCGTDIRRFTNDTLAFAFDCITDSASMRCCYDALGPAGPAGAPCRYLGLEPFPLRGHTRRDVKPEWILTFTMLGAAVDMPRPFGRPARPRDRAFGEAWFRGTKELVQNHGEGAKSTGESAGPRIELHPVELGTGGLAGVTTGLDRLRKGDVKGVKLVYEIA